MAETISEIQDYIDRNRSLLLEDWFSLIRHKSVSATGEGIPECCAWLKNRMEALRIQVTKEPVEPYPLLIGRLGQDPCKKTVLIYAHYDVKPAGDLANWHSDPFEPTVRDGKVFARGSADNKSPLMAHLEAVRYYQETGRSLPVNLLFVFEGCEEEGSTGLPEFLQEHKNDLKADLVFFSDGPKDPSNRPIIALGAKGDINIRLSVKTMNRHVHARYAPVLPSAAWKLVEILHGMKQGDKVLIPGFYDGILPLSDAEKHLLEKLPASEEALDEMYDAKPQHLGKDFYPRLLGQPTFNICWIRSGANGVVPAEAEALLDIRLVPGQKPLEIFQKVKDYIASLDDPTVTVTLEEGYLEPSKTPVDTPFLPAIEEVTREIYGSYVIYPCRPSSAPDYLWTNILGLPAIQVRWSDADSDNHAPNEHLSIDEYFKGIALTIKVLDALGSDRP